MSIIGAISIAGSGASTVIACSNTSNNKTNQQKADAIANKIITTDITVPHGANPDTTNAGTIKAITTALETANPGLEDLITKYSPTLI